MAGRPVAETGERPEGMGLKKRYSMYKARLIAFFLIWILPASAQVPDGLFADNNPRLTPQESRWLAERLAADSFDFSGKYMGFVDLQTGGFYGIGKFTLPVKKKSLATMDLSRYVHQLIRLDSAGRARTGYDALLVFVANKHAGKLRRLDTQKLINESRNRYPQIPPDAGLDTSANLSEANALFLNALYRADLYPRTDLDFRGKKVAIFNTHCEAGPPERVSMNDYVRRIRQQLDTYGFGMTDYTYVLTPEQKAESGGYDVIIQYRCKKDLPISYFIKLLGSGSK